MREWIRAGVAAVACAAIMAPGGADAASKPKKSRYTYFTFCDGLDTPSPEGDGMAIDLRSFWSGREPQPTINDLSGIPACDAALADARLAPAYWQRRVSLLLTRAALRLRQREFEPALADLALAEQASAGQDDPSFNHGLAYVVDLARAYALAALGRRPEAIAMATKAWQRRPYSAEAATAAFRAVGIDPYDSETGEMVLSLARTRPELLDFIYDRFLNQGRWTEAEALYPQLTPPPTLHTITYGGGGRYSYYGPSLEKDGVYRILRSGQHAYTLVVLGRVDEARAVLASARLTLEDSLRPPSPPKIREGSGRPRADEVRAYEAKVAAQARLKRRGEGVLKAWEQLVGLRERAGGGKAREVAAEILGRSLPVDRLIVELIETVLKGIPQTDTETRTALAAMKVAATPPRPARPPLSLKALLEAEAEVKTSFRRTRYKPASGSIFGSDAGVSARKSTDPAPGGGEAWIISFRDHAGFPSFAEEMVVLRAAEMARAAGKNGFVILSRSSTNYSVTNTYYGVPMSTYQDGIGVTMAVTFVDAASLPEAFRGAPWRVIDANAAYATLAPAYVGRDPKKKKSGG